MASLLEQIEEAQSENQSVQEELEAHLQRQRASDQSRIAWLIIWAFVVAVGAIFLLVLGSLIPGMDNTWKEPAEFLAGIVSSVLLPVVTLVLGYYFGKGRT